MGVWIVFLELHPEMEILKGKVVQKDNFVIEIIKVQGFKPLKNINVVAGGRFV